MTCDIKPRARRWGIIHTEQVVDMWEEELGDFGRKIDFDETFCFECHPKLGCFGRCCGTEVALTPYDIARLRRHLQTDTKTFLSTYANTYTDPQTGFPFVILKRSEEGPCVFSHDAGCRVYESRPGCCRNYPLARVVDEDGMTGKRLIRYRLQEKADYCQGLGRGPVWTIPGYCEANGLEPYERANDLFHDIAFEFYRLPHGVRHDKDVQHMIYGLVFNFDTFFDEYGRFPGTLLPEDDDALMPLVRQLAVNLIERAAEITLS